MVFQGAPDDVSPEALQFTLPPNVQCIAKTALQEAWVSMEAELSRRKPNLARRLAIPLINKQSVTLVHAHELDLATNNEATRQKLGAAIHHFSQVKPFSDMPVVGAHAFNTVNVTRIGDHQLLNLTTYLDDEGSTQSLREHRQACLETIQSMVGGQFSEDLAQYEEMDIAIPLARLPIEVSETLFDGDPDEAALRLGGHVTEAMNSAMGRMTHHSLASFAVGQLHLLEAPTGSGFLDFDREK